MNPGHVDAVLAGGVAGGALVVTAIALVQEMWFTVLVAGLAALAAVIYAICAVRYT